VSPATLLSSPTALHEAFDAALVDLDGVTYKGAHAIASAPDALATAREHGMRLMYVTNNASREPETVASHLTELGIPATSDQVMTAAQAGAALMAAHVKDGARVLVIGGAGLHTAVRNEGFSIVESAADHPDAVIQGFAPHLGWKELAEATYAVAAGAAFFASNLDMTLPTERGMAPGNGALVGVVSGATGVSARSAGKPEPTMFRMAAERLQATRPLVIGDRLDTDLKGARAAQYPGLLVLTGVSSVRDAVLAPPDQRPSFLGADLTSLAEPHPAPQRDGDRWMVAQAWARVDHGVLDVGDGTPLDRARAACVAAWDAVDSGHTLAVEALPELEVISEYG